MTSARRSTGKRAVKWLAVIVVSGVTVAAGLYGALPGVATRLAPHLAQRFGLTQFNITLRRPGPSGVDIQDILLATDLFRMQGKDVHVDWTWNSLVGRKIRRVTIRELDVAVFSSDEKSSSEPVPESVIPPLPVDLISVETLTLRFVDTGFIGTGTAQLGNEGLHVSLQGQQPEAASRLMMEASLTRAGVFDVRLHEREGGDAVPFLDLDGTLAGDTLSLTAQTDLHGFPLQLVQSMAGLPRGDGRVTATAQTQLPWPLPANLVWKELAAEVPTYAVDWRSTDGRIAIDLEGRQTKIRDGTVAARLDGKITMMADQQNIRATLPTDYAIELTDKVVTGGAGLTVDTKGSQLNAVLDVESFVLSVGKSLGLDSVFRVARLERPERPVNTARSGNPVSAPLTLKATATREGNFTLRLGERSDSKPAPWLVLNGKRMDDTLNLSGAIGLDGYGLAMAREIAGIADGNGRAAAQFQAKLPWPHNPSEGWRPLTARLDAVAVNWRAADGTVALQMDDGRATWRGGQLDAHIGGQITLSKQEQRVRLSLPPDYHLRFVDKTLSGGPGPVIAGSLPPANVTATLRSARVGIGETVRVNLTADLDATIPQGRSRGMLETSFVVTESNMPDINGTLAFTGDVEAGQRDLPAHMSADFDFNGKRLKADGKADYGPISDILYTLVHDMAAGSTTAKASLSHLFTRPIAAQWINGWKEDFDLDRAAVDAAVDMHWRTALPITLTATLGITDGDAHYEDFTAQGIAGQLRLSTSDVTRTDAWKLSPTRVNIDQIDMGVTMTDAYIDAAAAGDTVTVTEAGTKVLGGSAVVRDFDYQVDTGDAMFDLQLESIDLSRVLALEGDHVAGEGLLDGVLPVRLRANTPSAEKGILTARPPGGKIMLRPSLAAVGGQNELSFALQALTDFNYSKLEATVDYTESGDLTLGVQLQGRNPKVEANRPIHYNLTITENLPVLLESLQLQNEFTRRIEKKVIK